MIEITLLGYPHIRLNGKDVRIDSQKAQALLYFLVVSPRAHSRSSLAGLLWGDSSEEAARRSLRVAVSKLRSAVGDYILAENQSIGFDHSKPAIIDVAILRKAQAELPKIGQTARSTVSLVKGEFLEDFQVRNAPEFEFWQLSERENTASSIHVLLEALISHDYQSGNVERALRSARRLVAMDPWREESHRWLIRLLAETGKRDAALAQYEACRSILARELNVEPSVETRQLADAVRSGEIRAVVDTTLVRPPKVIPQNLPTPLTAFFGREAELEQIADLLTRDDCRILTLLGPGGVGKSRLALEAARRWLHIPDPPFANGMYSIPLAGITPEDNLAQTIALSLDLLPGDGGLPEVVLFSHLEKRSTLLILDNFEHLMEHAGWLLDLLAAAPGVKLLVTSQERLPLIEAWNLDLAGLNVPQQDTLEAIISSDAAKLFIERARRMILSFDEAAELEGIARICRLVEGLPLSLELAAAWVRGFSCLEIAKRIQSDIDFLNIATPSLPERQRGLQAVFRSSWSLLVSEEQSAYANLSVFHGGFSPAASEVVASAGRRQLLSLNDKSLIRRLPNGRYEIHEHLRSLAEQQLETGTKKALEQAHAYYFAEFLAARANFRLQADVTEVRKEIAAELDNIRRAWRWAVRERDEEFFNRSMSTLMSFFDLSGLFFEGEVLFAQAAEIMPEGNLLKAKLLLYQASNLFRLGQNERTMEIAQRALPVLEAHQEWEEMAKCLVALGNAVRDMGDHQTAAKHFSRSADLFRALDDLRGMSSAANNLGVLLYYEDDLPGALKQFQLALEARQKAGIEDVMTELGNIGLCYGEMGKYAEAIEYLERSFELAQNIGSPLGAGLARHNLGNAHRLNGELDTALTHLMGAIDTFREINSRDALAAALADLGSTYTELGEFSNAETVLLEGLSLETELARPRGIAYKHLGLGNLYLISGENSRAHDHYRQVLQQPEEKIGANPILNALIGSAVIRARDGNLQIFTKVAAAVSAHEKAGIETQQNLKRWEDELGIEMDSGDFGRVEIDELIDEIWMS